jgi:hypothetical protein
LQTVCQVIAAAYHAKSVATTDVAQPIGCARGANMIVPFGVRRVITCLAVLGLFAASARGGLIHRYSFKDPTVKDSVGSDDGKLKGAAAITGGKLVLDNADKNSDDEKLSYVEFASSVLPKGNSASLVVWFSCKDIGSFARILNIGDKDGAEGRAFIYFTPRNADDQARAAITATDAAGKTSIDTGRLDDGNVHMIAVVIDGTARKLHLFVDGKEPAAAQDLGDNTLDKVKPVNNWIGRSAYDQDAGLTASVSEFRVYDSALTADDAAAIFKAGPDALPAGK